MSLRTGFPLAMSRPAALSDELAALRGGDLYRRRRVLEGAVGREAVIDGRRLLNFCSNDYLGLAADERVRAALVAAVGRWGVGAGASPLVCGYTTAHRELEDALAEFTGRPRVLLFASGYAANMGTLGALLAAGDRVFEDRLNHASLLDGGRLSGARFARYRHADPLDLDARLAAGSAARTLVVTDGVFSMDGDGCPLPELVAVARRHGAWLMVDDAHGFGVQGRDGRGRVDARHFTTDDVQVLVGTFGKALGTCGAFVAGSDDLVELLVQRARHLIYSTALPAALAAATTVSLRIAAAEAWRREHLGTLVARFRAGAAALGLGLPDVHGPIQPIVLGAAARALAVSAALERAGVWVTAIRPPTVPAGSARLRVTFSAAHQPADVDRLLEALGVALQACPDGEPG